MESRRLHVAVVSLLLALPAIPAHTAAQNAVVARPVHLRRDPSTARASLRLLAVGDSLHLIEPDTVAGFLRAAVADSVEGWVWARNIRLIQASDLAPPSANAAVAEAAASHKACDLDGNAKGARDKASNRMKNRVQPPKQNQIDTDVTLKAMLAAGDDEERWTESLGAEVIGYVIAIKPGGEETVNCHSPFPDDYDTHIELALTTTAKKTRRVVIEITPRVRAKAAQQGHDWSTAALRDSVLHKWVRVRGWLFWDWRHEDEAQNTNPGSTKNWRATAWEIHPVTSIEVVPKPTR